MVCYDELILPVLPLLEPVLSFGRRRRQYVFLLCNDMLASSLELAVLESTGRFGSIRQTLANLPVSVPFLAKRIKELILPFVPFLHEPEFPTGRSRRKVP